MKRVKKIQKRGPKTGIKERIQIPRIFSYTLKMFFS